MGNKKRVIFAGTPDFAAKSLQVLINQQDALNIDIVAVYTQPDRKAGRGQKLTASAVKTVAIQHGIPVEQPVTFKKSVEEGLVSREILASYQPDVMVVAAYGLILPLGVLQTPTKGCLNIHASILPRWRGAAPIHRAILAGDKMTGISIMQMNQGLDTGDVLYTLETPILNTDTTASLHDKLADLGAKAISTVLADLPHYQQQAQSQNDELACYADKLNKKEGAINWQNTAEYIARQVRGMHPYPSTYSFINSKRVKIIQANRVGDEDTHPNELADLANVGKILQIDKAGILVACATSTLKITQLQFAGSKSVNAEQILQGSQLKIGDVFTNEPN